MSDGDHDAREWLSSRSLRVAIRGIARDIEHAHYEGEDNARKAKQLHELQGYQLTFARDNEDAARAFVQTFSEEFVTDWLMDSVALDIFISEHAPQFEQFVALRRKLMMEDL